MKKSKSHIRMQKEQRRRGMALLVVLFIIMAISVIGAGFIARSDAALLSGYNYARHNETDALAWGGLEHARALVTSPENAIPLVQWQNTVPLQLDANSSLYYDLTIGTGVETANADPNLPSTYVYPVECQAYKNSGGKTAARSVLEGTLFYDHGSTQAYYISLRRQ